MADNQINFEQALNLEDLKYYKLPKLVPVQQPIPQYATDDLPDHVKDSVKNILEHLRNTLKRWEYSSFEKVKQSGFRFNIPKSGFSGENRPIIQYKQSDRFREVGQVRKLNAHQLKSIYETATFDIEFPMPYKWQLSQWIMKGQKAIAESYNYDMSFAFHQIYQIQCRFESLPDVPRSTRRKNKHTSIKGALYQLSMIPKNVLEIFIGFPNYLPNVSDDLVHNEIEFQRQKRLNQNKYLDKTIFEFFSVFDIKDEARKNLVHQRIEKLQDFFEDFQKISKKLREAIEDSYEITLDKDEKDFQSNDQEEQHRLFVLEGKDYQIIGKYDIKIDFNKPVEQTVAEATRKAIIQEVDQSNLKDTIKHPLKCLLEWHQHYQHYLNKLEVLTQQKREELTKEVIEQHKIKSQVEQYLYREVEFRLAPYVKAQDERLLQELKQLVDSKYPDQSKLYNDYLDEMKKYEVTFTETKKDLFKRNQKPSYVFTVTRELFPPYKSERIVNSYSTYYRLIRTKVYECPTDFYGWRLYLMILRCLVWIFNSAYILFSLGIVGPLGVRALVGISKFNPYYTCDIHTGEVKKSPSSHETVISRFRLVLRGMSNSRESFERLPDTGFFGKNLTRVFNLIEVYIFRFLFVGLFLNLICFPTLIVSSIIIQIGLSVTSWIWIPLYLIVRYLFALFIFDPDIGRNYRVREGKRPATFFAIPQEINRLVLRGVIQGGICLVSMVVLHPLGALMCAIFAFLRYGLRQCYDHFFYFIVSKMGRTPASANKMAWIISGPGVSRKYFHGVDIEYVFVLIYAELEKQIYQEYVSRIDGLLEEPQTRSRNTLQSIYSCLDSSRSYSDSGIQALHSQLSDQISNAQKLYPIKPHNQVRFSQLELRQYLRITKEFIKKQIDLKGMNSFIWKRFNVREGDYNELTRTIWRQAFGNDQILEPFEDLEMRFMLVPESSSRMNTGSVRRALKGYVDLDELKVKIAPKKQKQQQVEDLYITYVDGEKVVRWLELTQSHHTDWSSYKTGESAVYLNYNIEQKVQLNQQ